jgi:hypothetical protein
LDEPVKDSNITLKSIDAVADFRQNKKHTKPAILFLVMNGKILCASRLRVKKFSCV